MIVFALYAIKCPFYSKKTGMYGIEELTRFGGYGRAPCRKKDGLLLVGYSTTRL